MAVYEHSYRRYEGPLTPPRWRFLILPRYAVAEVLRGRLFIALFTLCFAPPFAGLIMIYLHHNLSALKLLNLPLDRLQEALPIDSLFFERGLALQGFMAFLIALAVGPALISPDLRNNGLPLYFSRPFSRAEYVLGKMSVLVVLMSLVTWVPGLLLFFLEANLEGAEWLAAHWRIAGALIAASAAWIALLSLVVLAVSAWVKWKPVARIVILILYFVLAGFGLAADKVLGTWWGVMFSMQQVWSRLRAALFDVPAENDLPVAAAMAALAAGCLICLWLLSRRVRAYEVVR
ncbi:MAG TPA: hypothetical protein VHR45_17920 [Thermoanaerobaculia bacterium]|nr:hypothetical protein [Thermoanaerobaculia bacterium]